MASLLPSPSDLLATPGHHGFLVTITTIITYLRGILLSWQGRPSPQAQTGMAVQAPGADQHEADHGDTVGNQAETAVAVSDRHSTEQAPRPVEVVLLLHSCHSTLALSLAVTSRPQMKSIFPTTDCAIVPVAQGRRRRSQATAHHIRPHTQIVLEKIQH